MPTTPPLPAHLLELLLSQGGAGTAEQLRALGITSNDIARFIRQGALVRLGRGQFTLPTPTPTPLNSATARSSHLRELAAALAVCPDAVAGLRSAALAWNLPVWQVPALPEIIRMSDRSRMRSARTIRTELPPEQVVRGKTLSVTSLERTATDVAVDLTTPQALITVDAALRQGASRELMRKVLAARGRIRGVGRARETLTWADPHSESPLESWGRGELLQSGIPRPRCNVTLELPGASFRVDALWDDYGIVGEADGRIKYEGPLARSDTLWREKLRQEWLENEAGLLVVRWTSSEIRWTPRSVVDRWWRAAARRKVSPWIPPPELRSWQPVLNR